MQLQDVKVGLKVQFISLRNGKRVGLDKDIYTIKDINFNDWGQCDILVESEGYEVYTTHEGIEIASETAIKAYELELNKKQANLKYEQLTIFDILEVS